MFFSTGRMSEVMGATANAPHFAPCYWKNMKIKKFRSHFLFILIKRQCNKNGQASDVNSRWEFLHVFSCFWQQLKLKCRWWHCKAVKTNFLVAFFLIVTSTFSHCQQCLSARPKQPQKQQKQLTKAGWNDYNTCIAVENAYRWWKISRKQTLKTVKWEREWERKVPQLTQI